MAKQLPRGVRSQLIVDAAVTLTTACSVFELTFADVAEKCDPVCSERTVRDYFPRKIDLWRAVIATNPDRYAEEAKKLGND